jgi:membrane-bound ClpP family serine protease
MAQWSAPTLIRYSLLQLPDLVLVGVVGVLIKDWLAWPPWLFWSLMAAWIAKDVAMFPLVWRAYDPEHTATSEALIGAVGVARERLQPTGYIVVHGVWWRAEVTGGEATIEPGNPVRVVKRYGLTLLVVPEPEPLRT